MLIVDKNISCEKYRENEAVRLMNISDYYNFILCTNQHFPVRLCIIGREEEEKTKEKGVYDKKSL